MIPDIYKMYILSQKNKDDIEFLIHINHDEIVIIL